MVISPSFNTADGGVQSWACQILKCLQDESVSVDAISRSSLMIKAIFNFLFLLFRKDVLIFMTWKYFVFFSPFLLFSFKRKIIVFYHGMEVNELSGLIQIYHNFILKRFSVKCVVNSAFTKNILKKKASNSNVVILRPLVKTVHPSTFLASIKCKQPIKKKIILLSVCRLVERKNIFNAIMSVIALREKGVDIEYNIIGNGPLLEKYRSYLKHHEIEFIKVLGSASPKLLKSFYVKSNLFILPSKTIGDDVEGYGISLIEANSYGLPVISGNSGGMKEAVNAGVSGVVCDGSVEDIIEKIQVLSSMNLSETLCYKHAKKHFSSKTYFLNLIK